MKIAIVYVFPMCVGQKYFEYAVRFLETYHSHPPLIEHETVVVLNGGTVSSEVTCLFSELPHCHFIERDNSGYDIGAYQSAARSTDCDLMVFFGASTYLKLNGWLRRMVEAFDRHGDTIYGAMGNRGNLAIGVYPHIRTTAFWMTPKLFNAYPGIIRKKEQRYGFEHGKNCLTEWVKKSGKKPLVVTKNGAYEWALWDADANGFHQGNQSAMIAGDRISEPPFYPIP